LTFGDFSADKEYSFYLANGIVWQDSQRTLVTKILPNTKKRFGKISIVAEHSSGRMKGYGNSTVVTRRNG
jgi:hypothetical protein